MAVEVVTFGEAMLRLSPPGRGRLEQAQQFDAQPGGAEVNAAAALARLGRSVAWVSRLPDNPLGRLVAARVRGAGVATDHLLWAEGERLGLYFVEHGASPRADSVLYDRQPSALANLRPGQVPWAEVLRGARWFHVTGITPALSPGCAAATAEALDAARAAGVPVSLDVNYRSKLWTPEAARAWLTAHVRRCAVVIVGAEDAALLFDVHGAGPAEVAAGMAERFGLRAAVVPVRQGHSVWRNAFSAVAHAGGATYQTRTYEVEIVDRLGAGDACAAGLIDGLLDGDVQRGLDWGVALGALKHTIPGEWAWATRAEVAALAAGGSLRVQR